MALVLTEVDGAVGTIALNRPEKANCLSNEFLAEIISAFDDFEGRRLRVVVLRAARGMKVWSAGHDISDLPLDGSDPLEYKIPLEDLLRRVQAYPGPVIAMVGAGVWGGACDLVSTCDIVIGSEGATFAMTPAKLGIAYNPSGLTHFLGVVGLHKAKEMFFTAQPVTAQDALRVGLLNHLVPADELEAFTYGMAATITRNSPVAIRAIKEQFRLLTRGHTLAAETFERVQSLRRAAYQGEDYREGLHAFAEKRPPDFTGW
jgi:methylmalonyl-CoA decarboxylase